MTAPAIPHVTAGFEQDLTRAIEHWKLDHSTPARVLARYVMGCLTEYEAVLRRREDFLQATRGQVE